VRFSAKEIAEAVGGTLHGADVEVRSVTTDSRTARPGSLFVAIVADRDGHMFVEAAVEGGASAYITARGQQPVEAAAIEVDDTGVALVDLGRYARGRLPDLVVGITGSVGKTTVKDLTLAAMSEHHVAHANERSFNNELGVPLTLANAPDDTEAVIVEMGARGAGHIELLCEIARPTIGVVTAVELAHTELFGSIDAVAEAKGELVAALPEEGVAILNADRPLVASMAARTSARVLTFGVEAADIDVTASDIAFDEHLRPRFRLHTPWGTAPVEVPVSGVHQVHNALAASAAALAAGVPLEAVADGLARARLSPWRMAIERAPSGALIINDAYNANPASTEAALRSLARVRARRRIAVLGIMAELGEAGPEQHRRIAALAHDLGIEVLAVDAADYGVSVVHGVDGALRALHGMGLGAGDAVLVKASRVAGLEAVASALVG